MEEEDEIWKDIIGFEGRYSVSNKGRVRSEDRICNTNPNRFYKGVILTNYVDKYGYNYNTIGNKKYKTHQLVAKAFIPNPENKPTVNHKDEIKSNNFSNNLEWMTVAEQNKYSLGINIKLYVDGEVKVYSSVLEACLDLKLDESTVSSKHKHYLRTLELCNNVLLKNNYRFRKIIKVYSIDECKQIISKKEKYVVRITVSSNNRIFVGNFDTLLEAISARNKFILEHNIDDVLYDYKDEEICNKENILSNINMLESLLSTDDDLILKLISNIKSNVINL